MTLDLVRRGMALLEQALRESFGQDGEVDPVTMLPAPDKATLWELRAVLAQMEREAVGVDTGPRPGWCGDPYDDPDAPEAEIESLDGLSGFETAPTPGPATVEGPTQPGQPVTIGEGVTIERLDDNAAVEAPKPPINDRFPGRPDYVGPVTGVFGWVYHSSPCRGATVCTPRHTDYQTVLNRLKFVERQKEGREQRFFNMVRLDPSDLPDGVYDALVNGLAGIYNYRDELNNAVLKHIPDSVSGATWRPRIGEWGFDTSGADPIDPDVQASYIKRRDQLVASGWTK